MTEQPIPKFKELAIEDRLLVLEWMRDAIHGGMKKTITSKTYAAFVHALNKGSTFNPEEIWETIHPQSREHFQHAAEILAELESDIEYCQDTIDATDETVENDPFDDESGDQPDPDVDGVAQVEEEH